MVIRSESNITVSKFVNQRSFEVSNNLTLRWLKSIDRHILNKYNNEYSEDSYFITTILNSLNASCGDTLLMLSVRRAIGFCKVLLITTQKCRSTLHTYIQQVIDKVNNKEESKDQCENILELKVNYKPFEKAKVQYISIGLLLLKLFSELKRCAIWVDYLYSIMLKRWKTDIECGTLHLGLFYEIVLGDKDIIVTLDDIQTVLNILLSGLTNYESKECCKLELSFALFMQERMEFSGLWDKRMKSYLYNTTTQLSKSIDMSKVEESKSVGHTIPITAYSEQSTIKNKEIESSKVPKEETKKVFTINKLQKQRLKPNISKKSIEDTKLQIANICKTIDKYKR